MKIIIIFLILTASTLFLGGCAADLTDYQKNKIQFDIKKYFNGNIVAWGIVQDNRNKVNRRFCVEIKGTWQDNKGVLAEKFYFNDGETTYRNWQLTKLSDGTYQGEAEDVVGIAVGKHQGFAFQFNYQLLLNVGDDNYEVTMDDWMFQIDQYRVMNKTAISKFGINIANVTIFFDKENLNQSCLLAST